MNTRGWVKSLLSVIFFFMTACLEMTQLRAITPEEWCIKPSKNVVEIYTKNGNEDISPNDEITLQVEVKQKGMYTVMATYQWGYYSPAGNSINFQIEDQQYTLLMPGIWKNRIEEKAYDRYGNEVVPKQEPVSGFITNYLFTSSDLVKKPFTIELQPGTYSVHITPNNYNLKLKELSFVGEEEVQDQSAEGNKATQTIVIEAEDYNYKSDSYIRGSNTQNPSVVPYETNKQYINVLDGNTFKGPTQKVIYEFEVPETGNYYLGIKFKQDSKIGMDVYRNIEIDGKIPNLVYKNIAFPYRSSEFQNKFVMNQDQEYVPVYLEKGIHTLGIEVTAKPVEDIIQQLREMMLEINATGMELKKITGGNTDKYRTWEIDKYMPTIIPNMNRWITELGDIYQKLEDLSQDKPSFANGLKKCVIILEEVLEEPTQIPQNSEKIFEGSGSVAQIVSDLINPMIEQPLTIDRIYLTGDKELPKANAGFGKKLIEEVKKFCLSFNKQTQQYNNLEVSEDSLNIWVARSLQYVEVLQQMIDNEFTPKTGIKVECSIIPSEQKLILSNAAGTSPDIAMGVSCSLPYDMALRGSIVDMFQFDDFLEYYSKEYDLECLVPLWIDGKMSGVVETRGFNVLFYRTDVFDKLGLEPPETWEDVKLIMPTLKRYNMNFHTQLSTGGGMKSLGVTAPFNYQLGGDIYSEDGISTTINSETGEKAFTLMTDLFSIHSVATTTSNFYNEFRYGKTPIGVADLNTYVMLKYAAPEIAGQWDIALVPGIENEDGTINRQMPSAERACFIMEGSEKKDQAWEFLKWWLSRDVQAEYTINMQTRFGPEFIWNTANLAAFDLSVIEPEHREVILEQWEQTKEVPRHPAQYMVEREISNAWNKVVIEGENKRVALDRGVITINREIQRKLEEFGYVKNGKVVKPYEMATLEKLQKGGK